MGNFSTNPIRNRTARIIMFTFVVLLVLSAFTLIGTQLAGFEVPIKVIGIILLGAVAVNISEIGLKRLTPLSDLKKLAPQQYVSLVVGFLVSITAIFFLFGISPTFIVGFAPGLLFVEAGVIFIEIFI